MQKFTECVIHFSIQPATKVDSGFYPLQDGKMNISVLVHNDR